MARKQKKPEKTRVSKRSIVETGDGPVEARSAKHARYLRMRQAGDDVLTREQWEKIILDHNSRCAYCGVRCERMTQDHVIPLSRGGLHVASNVVASCRECNGKKMNRTPEEWGIVPHIWSGGDEDDDICE